MQYTKILVSYRLNKEKKKKREQAINSDREKIRESTGEREERREKKADERAERKGKTGQR